MNVALRGLCVKPLHQRAKKIIISIDIIILSYYVLLINKINDFELYYYSASFQVRTTGTTANTTPTSTTQGAT